jgi:hypothetical protein
MSDLSRPADQNLQVIEMFAAVIFDPDLTNNPPIMDLTFDVEHAETQHQWRTAVRLSRHQIGELTSLLVHACQHHGIAFDE